VAYFAATGSEQSFTMPKAGRYYIDVAGAEGAVGNSYSGSYGSVPGKGARLRLLVDLAAGDVLTVIVGKQGKGTNGTAKDGASGGSGGGTFVFKRIASVTNANYQFTKNGVNYEVLAVAAGGGGTGDQSYKSAVSNGANGLGAAYKHPGNYVAWSTQTASLTSSVSLSAPLSISQYIANGAGGAYYTRGSSTGTGGFGMGGATDDNPSCGGGWSGNNTGVYSWAINTSAIGEDGANSGDGYAEITELKTMLTNLIPNPSFETTADWSGLTRSTTYADFGQYSSRLGSTSGTGTYINTVKPTKPPVKGHKYYGRHYLRTTTNVTTADNRFELYAGDGAGLNFVFGNNGGNHPQWDMESKIITLTTLASAASNYSIRNFTVNASNYVYCDGLMLIDLTAAFGAGNEPSKEWCDRVIPFFEGTRAVTVRAKATITRQPVSGSYIINTAASALTVAATGQGTLSYQWQRSSNGSSWTNISGATGTAYTPPTTALGTIYYRCVVTDTLGAPALYPSTALYPGTVLYPMAEGLYDTAATNSTAVTVLVYGAVAPTITTQPVSATYDNSETPVPLTVAASPPANGTLEYQWQNSPNGNTWTNISGATGTSYTPPTSTNGSISYRCVVTNVVQSDRKSTNSNTATITIRGAVAPTISAQPQSSAYGLEDTPAPLSVTASTTQGTLSYQWSVSGDGGITWANIAGATSSTYTPPTDSTGTKQYRVTVTSTVGISTASVVSDPASVTVYAATIPVFTRQPTGATYDHGAEAAPLTAAASAEWGAVLYQWERSEDAGASWSEIPGATAASYMPPTTPGGTVSYRLKATNIVGPTSESAYSDTAVITILSASAPVFAAPLSGAEYDQGDPTTALIGTAASPHGTVTYQWYGRTGSGAFSALTGQTAAAFTPPSAAQGVYQYYVVATNTVGTSTATAQSNTVTITVYGATEPIFTVQPVSADYIENDPAAALTVAATVERGSLAFQWQLSRGTVRAWSDIPGADANAYTPPTSVPGTYQYRCVAVNTVGTSVATSFSETAQITVTAAQVPVFLHPLVNATYSLLSLTGELDGTAEVTDGGTITYRWFMAEKGQSFVEIPDAVYAAYQPKSITAGVWQYYVIATNTLHNSVRSATSNTAEITIIDRRWTAAEKMRDYLNQLRTPFVKLCRLRFLQPDGSTAFALDNNPFNRRSGAFIADGSISCNLQNGTRRTATVNLSNLDAAYDYNLNMVWFGQEIAIDEGLVLSNGEDYYIQQGIFCVESPTETVEPGNRVAQYNLTDKWSMLDGTLFGYLEGTYEVKVNTNIFEPIQAILSLDRGNGRKVDAVPPVFTEYYNTKTQKLADGTTVKLTDSPYTLRVDGESGSYGDVVLGMAEMVNAWVGYDSAGALRLDPSQDDILDTDKPILWRFSMEEAQLLGAAYTVKNTEVYNDYIVIGEQLDDNSQPAGRATNLDPMSDTNVQTIGRKTFRQSAAGYATKQQCEDRAVWELKRSAGLQKAVSISCTQMFHLEENNLVTVTRTDKPGSPVERHLIMGFERPLAGTGEMTITAVSVNDYPNATVTGWPE